MLNINSYVAKYRSALRYQHPGLRGLLTDIGHKSLCAQWTSNCQKVSQHDFSATIAIAKKLDVLLRRMRQAVPLGKAEELQGQRFDPDFH
jgi:hypothetical protein